MRNLYNKKGGIVNRTDKMAAANRRFGTMAGVTPLKVTWEFER